MKNLLETLQNEDNSVITKSSDAEELIKYKQLLDDGILTQDEFDAKKKQILGL